MRLTLWSCVLLSVIGLGSCSSPERPRSSGDESGAALLTFASDTSEARLLLRTDSTFVLTVPPVDQVQPHVVTGRLNIADDHYRLFFTDTLAGFNKLLTSVHTDASVVAYPDYSVVLDKKLQQLYVKGALVTADSVSQP
ncbi:MAG: hypothetical protein WA958_16555 [Tunicatimonas sp.]